MSSKYTAMERAALHLRVQVQECLDEVGDDLHKRIHFERCVAPVGQLVQELAKIAQIDRDEEDGAAK